MTPRHRLAVLAVTVAAGVAAAFDLTVVVRGPLMLAALLVVPGLAASFSMGPMTAEMRALVSVAASGALLTVLAAAMLLVGGWSPGVAFAAVAAVTIGCVLFPVRPHHRGPHTKDET